MMDDNIGASKNKNKHYFCSMKNTLKIISYNVNGIRAALRKGFDTWLAENDFDIVCLQETKAWPEQLDLAIFENLGYHHYWCSAEKKGYSSVAILSKVKADKITYGCGIEKYDREGRFLQADFGNLSVVSAYFPSGSRGSIRQDFKMEFLADFLPYIERLKAESPERQWLISGDYNICHQAMDIHNPVQNKNSSGFLPEEREWMTTFFEAGFVDTFRHFHPEKRDCYSWWSYRANARNNNKGWRIDYHAVSENLKDKLVDADIFPMVKHSDHCPIFVEISLA